MCSMCNTLSDYTKLFRSDIFSLIHLIPILNHSKYILECILKISFILRYFEFIRIIDTPNDMIILVVSMTTMYMANLYKIYCLYLLALLQRRKTFSYKYNNVSFILKQGKAMHYHIERRYKKEDYA